MRDRMLTKAELLEQKYREEIEEVEFRAEERVEKALRQYRGLVAACLMLTGALGYAAAQRLYQQDVSGCVGCAVGALFVYGVSRLVRRHWRDFEPLEEQS